jgi:hypothetical protein
VNYTRKQMIERKKNLLYSYYMQIAKTEKNSQIFLKYLSKIQQLKIELFAMEYK